MVSKSESTTAVYVFSAAHLLFRFPITSNQWSDGLQVQLMYFKSEGNNSLTRWAIYPAGSASYFSNATAMVGKIIIVLQENFDMLLALFLYYLNLIYRA